MTGEISVSTGLIGLVGILLGIVGFFLVGLNKRFERNNEVLNTFCSRLEVLMEKIKTIQEDTARGAETIKRSIDRNEKEIDLLRKKVHFIINKMMAIKLRLEMCGIKMSDSDGWSEKDDDESKETE